ncbi:MAG TPA: L,D-transpeptidase family protein [Halanaerobiales bacterium]|nr:L,D-transpeptidase family protein [Halanaerobiales bacterium]
MKKIYLYFIILILFFSFLIMSPVHLSAQTNLNYQIKEQLSTFKEYEINNLKFSPPYFLNKLNSLYEINNYNPFWFGEVWFKDSAYQLMEVIKNIENEGLNPKDYRYDFLSEYFHKTTLNRQELALIDILMTNSFLLLRSHFKEGILNPETLKRDWEITQNDTELYNFINNTVQNNNVIESLYSLLPQSENYIKLRNKLKEYKTIKKNGGFITFTGSRVIDKGMNGEDVLNLKKRLKQTQDFQGIMDEEFGQLLEKAVINFQKRNGLNPDGVVGPKTKSALNISVKEKIKKIIINMERLRWLPQSLGNPYILVNIADYKLRVIENKEELFNLKVIVGQRQRSTPVFSEKISYIVLNPSWTVPKKIAALDKLPLIKKDINYLPENNYKVLKVSNGELVEVDYTKINWDNLNEDNFNYFLRQQPGPNNALGQIKFMFPNKYSVYLHDTPSKELFSAEQRNFSSGCIRVQEPFKLAEYILKKDEQWDEKKIKQKLAKNNEQIIYLKNKIPIHIVYMTAWVNNNYKIHFRNDIYNRDQRLIDAYYNIERG